VLTSWQDRDESATLDESSELTDYRPPRVGLRGLPSVATKEKHRDDDLVVNRLVGALMRRCRSLCH
jgi:hypothetical protein